MDGAIFVTRSQDQATVPTRVGRIVLDDHSGLYHTANFHRGNHAIRT